MTDSHLAVIVLAAGPGTRMKSVRPKVLHPLAGVPLIGHVLATARELSAAHVITVVRHERDSVSAAILDLMPEAIVVDQDELPGTGRAVEMGLGALPDDFEGDVVVVSGDVPLLDAATLSGLLEAHRHAAAAATLLSAIVDDATGYGRIVRDADGSLNRIVEQKDAADDELSITEINSGTYVFSVASLRTQLPRVGTGNAQGEKYLTDVVALLREAGQPVAAVPVPDPWMVEGINDRVQLSRMAARLNAMIVRGWQVAGVTVQDPASTWIDLRATLAEDVELLPGTHISGATTVARGARIGPQTTLHDCEVGENAVVIRSDATLAVIGANASVGPFAFLRPGTELAADGKIGTFVETKNAKIGVGSKVPHLSYIGDTTVGEGSNIGAGTITANYDGVDKHATVVGSHVRTGSHNVFVAPVTIGDGAYSGAGTVIRKDVPPGALAINVAPQRNMDGWVAEHRAGSKAADAALKVSADKRDGSVEGAEGTDWIDWSSSSGRRSVAAIKITGQKRLVLVSGRAHMQLAVDIAAELKTDLVHTDARTFANGEIYARFDESIRGCDMFVIQSHTAPINEWLMEQLIMIDAAKRASAKRITVVAPFYPYARQDKKGRGREPISARLIADLFKAAGADRIMSVDLHAAQIQGFFDGPVDHLFAMPVLLEHFKAKLDPDMLTVVSPDMGRVRVADIWSDKLGAPLAIIHKRRDPLVPNQVSVHEIVGEVEGRVCLLVDDMIDTGRTIVKAAEALKAQGATAVVVAATHAVFSPPAHEILQSESIDEVVVTDTLPIPEDKRWDRLTVLPIAPLIARAIHEVFDDGSVTSMFDGAA